MGQNTSPVAALHFTHEVVSRYPAGQPHILTYAYPHHNPLIHPDPIGLQSISDLFKLLRRVYSFCKEKLELIEYEKKKAKEPRRPDNPFPQDQPKYEVFARPFDFEFVNKVTGFNLPKLYFGDAEGNWFGVASITLIDLERNEVEESIIGLGGQLKFW